MGYIEDQENDIGPEELRWQFLRRQPMITAICEQVKRNRAEGGAMQQAREELNKALGHLEKAREQIKQGSWSGAIDKADGEIIYATNSARHALELLEQKKEEK